MTDYLPLLSRAVTGLERNTAEARRSVYDRARQALLKQLRSLNPPLAESEITRERLALEEAIRRIETQTVRPPERAAPPPPPSPPPPPPSSPPPVAAPARGSSAAPMPQDLDAAYSLPGDPAVLPPAAATTARREPVREARPAATPASPAPRRPAAPPPARNPVPDDAFHIEEPIAAPATPAPSPSPRGPRMPEPSVNGYGDTAAAAPSARPGPFRGRSVDYAKADAQKAMKAKMIVGGTIGGLILIMLVIGFLHRDRIFSMGTGASRPPASQSTASEPPKASDRVAPDTSTQQTSRPSGQSSLPAAVAQRAVLYEENPSGGGQQLQTFVGTVVWKTETISPGPGRPPELGMRVEIEIPDRKMTVIMTVRRNPDTTLPASHTVEVQFTTPGDPFGGVSNVPGLRAKTTETAQGAPLSGLVVRVMPGFFLIGLSAIDADREQNLMLLRERGWLDLPFVYNNGRRAVLVIEKGAPGERVVNEAIAAWGG